MSTFDAVVRQGLGIAPTRPRPVIQCRRPNPDRQLLRPGTVVWSVNGRAVVFLGDEPGLVDADRLAPELRQARAVTLLSGDLWGVARPFKQQLRDVWTAATREAGKLSKPPTPAKPVTERCGQPRMDGQPCAQRAGWGSDTPGEGPCRHHGGSTVERKAEAEHVVEQALKYAKLIVKAAREPLTPAEQVEAATAMRDVLAAQKRRRHHR